MQVQKENFMDFLSADASTDVLINNKQLWGTKRTGGRDWILEFMDDFEYINKFNVAHAIDHYQNNRQKYYEELSTFDTFGKEKKSN